MKFTSEIETLLAAVAVTREPRPAAAPAEDLDWEGVFALAKIHAVVPQLYRLVFESRDGHAPAAFRARLRAEFMRNWHHNMKLAHELADVAACIERDGIEVLALKGPALAMQAYGDVAMREFSDVDLFVRRADLARAASILERRGYYARRYSLEAEDGGAFFDFESEFRQAGGATIDLHGALAPSFFPISLDTQAIWRRTERVRIAEGEVATLGATDAARFVAEHASKHGWRSLNFVADFAALTTARSDQIDWDNLLDDCAGNVRMTSVAIILAGELCGAAFPAPISSAARRNRDASALARDVRRRIFEATESGLSLFHDWVVPLRAIEGARRRLRYVVGRSLRPTMEDREYIALPRWMYWAYYLTRPIRMASLHGHRLFRAARGGVEGV